jgi:diguanylate cyclase (GGDEF)-like protein/PAS domain S-box-containing protein
MPLLCAIAIENFIEGHYFVALLSCVMLLIVVLLGYVIKGRIDEKFEYKIYSVLFRLFNAAVGIAILYEIGIQSNFSRIGWCYIYPVLIFFAVGVMEGMIWVSIFYGILAFSILNLDLQGITLFQIQELRSRFLVSFFVVCMLSLFLAHGFRHAQQRLLHHQRILKESENGYREAYQQLNIEMQERKQAGEALRAEKQRFQILSESAPFGIVVIDKADTFKYINPQFREIFGYDLNDAPDGKTWFRKAFPDPTYRHHAISVWINELGSSKPGEKISKTFTVVCKDGTEKIVNFIPVRLETGEYFMSCEDITERKRAEEKLREGEERFRELAENIREVFYIYEPDIHQISYISPAYMEIWGRTCESLYQEPKSIWDNVHPEDKDRVMRSLEKKSRGEVEEVYRIVRPDGSIRWIKDRSFPIYDNSGKTHRIVGIAADITDLKFGEEKLKYLSLHDPLTGLYNRIYFEEEMTRIEKSRYDTVGIISCDVDGLKLVNDTLGHNQGDNLLVAAAGVIQGSFREGDLIARIGGDEFSVVLPNTTEPAVENACQRIQEAVVSYNATNPELPLSISIGFAVSHGVHRNLKDLFKEADNNMYRKKLYHTQSVRSTIVKTLINTLKARDLATEKHLIRLEKLLVSLAVFIGLPESTTSDLALLARFHDIGKVGISDSILFKKGPLTSEEWTEMKRHCEIGYRIALSASDLIPIADWILKHHEWWNGGGYPLGIKGEEIPIECRLLAIAEAYEALTSVHPYRRASPHAKAVAELLSHSGTQFDPKLLEKFVEMLETHSPESESNETSAV